MAHKRFVILAILGSATTALADPARIAGTVTDGHGAPLPGATVVIDGIGSQQSAITDANGRYQVTVDGAGQFSAVFLFGKSRAEHTGTVAADATTQVDGVLEQSGEVIQIHERPRPAVMPKPTRDPRILPRYSDAAVEHDTWARAWMLLDVDEQGTVTRAKFLKRPGSDLDAIAMETTLKTTFTPARDKWNAPTRAYVVWPIEWPSFWWLVTFTGVTTRRPAPDSLQLAHVPCRGSGPMNLGSAHPAYRDCSLPDLSKSDAAEPWHTAPLLAARAK